MSLAWVYGRLQHGGQSQIVWSGLSRYLPGLHTAACSAFLFTTLSGWVQCETQAWSEGAWIIRCVPFAKDCQDGL